MSELDDRLCAIVADVNPTVSIDPTSFDKTFADLGIDSLDFANVLLQVEEALGVSVSDEESGTLKTLADLKHLIETKRKG